MISISKNQDVTIEFEERYSKILVLFRRPSNDKHGDFYNTKLYVHDDVDGDHFHLSLDELYGMMKESGRLAKPSYNLGSKSPSET